MTDLTPLDRARAPESEIDMTEPEPLPHAWEAFNPETRRPLALWFAAAAEAHELASDPETARHAAWAASVLGAYDEFVTGAAESEKPASGSWTPLPRTVGGLAVCIERMESRLVDHLDRIENRLSRD